MTWYLIQTKPRSENLALNNLSNQGYECYLPMVNVEKVVNKKIKVYSVPLFPRYLFIKLNLDFESKSWFPIRSTKGVSNLVKFGQTLAKINDNLVEHIYSRERFTKAEVKPLYTFGQDLKISSGPFTGFDSIYQGMDAEMRVIVLLEFMRKPMCVSLELNHVQLN